MIEIYTDGGCDPNPGLGAWAFVRIDKKTGHIQKSSGSSGCTTTNNRMEYTAMIEALRSVNKEDVVNIYTDSKLLCNTINLWMYKWANNNWKKNIKNLDLVFMLYESMKNRKNTKIMWVKAHNGNYYNEMADRLCSDVINTFYLKNVTSSRCHD